MLDNDAAALNERIAERLTQLRAERGLTLQALADRSGVSRSMISVVERGESSPTAVLLDKLAAGLGVPLAALFNAPAALAALAAGAASAPKPLSRSAEQPVWRDPASGYLRRNVSPAGVGAPAQIVAVEFPPGARVAYEAAHRQPRVHQQVWLLQGRMDVTVGATRHKLNEGDCLAHTLDEPVMFHNPSRQLARYAVVLVSDGAR